ncbi:hypothetical protein M4D57_15420 [Brevibacillus borstelensis]|uniref:hypothetical protein n=1 Tax=Brevibacillus borstelensis TaxID=45462 RepID=UPI0002A51CF8|nr:hypothetical protein [Brevibacillus borstelensis]ELK42381.1 hypothetical protein D478_08813 [Brevibacillus agri BAB-2500]MCC0566450.1 hypothetical protein [Brevibacillus borstelensis]MCM3559961.1 hypothetical protein [Brevibacillus borstelensis]
MEFSIGDRIEVTSVNFSHVKRVNIPFSKIVGMSGIIVRKSLMEDNAYNVKLDIGETVLLYEDEIRKI